MESKTDDEADERSVISVTEAADILDLTPGRVRQLIRNGQLAYSKIGTQYVVLRSDVIAFAALERKPGRAPRDTR